jgi:phosphatidylinositol-3-phosphatase
MTDLARGFLGVGLACWAVAAGCFAAPPTRLVPHYAHVFVIIAENKGFDQLMDHPDWTPEIHKLAKAYGLASQFYAEVHSSEGNYIAMLGGDTFGIHDDDAFFCKAGLKNQFCEKSGAPNYVDHDIMAKSLMDQMAEKGLTWKAYMEDIPSAGSLVPRWPTANYPAKGVPNAAYAAKHNGFVNFHTVNTEPYPGLMEHFVGFSQLDADLESGEMPNYAHIVPDQCNEMHGMGRAGGADVPADCLGSNLPGLVKRGDAEIGMLVRKIMQSKVWSAPENVAIVVTFDENDGAERKSGLQGCCGFDPKSLANFGGGHIVTIVITNHGPRGIVDPTPYNHYSLLRTVEDAFGITEHLGHAADTDKGVVSMAPLFATGGH